MRRLACVLLLVAACGEDETNPPPKPGATPAANPNQKKDDKGKLQARAHVEDWVRCPLPNDGKPDADAKECKPDSPTCKEGTYCLQFSDKWFCEPCAERDVIRHDFRERDFATEQSRDPFRSYVIIPAALEGQGSAAEPVAEPHKNCTRKDQFPAPKASYADLKLVGIVAQGTARKALMMDNGNPPLGWIIKRGDCVGKEKAVVKEIGTGDITFVVEADPSSKRQAEQRTVPLHPMSPTMMDQDEEATAPETQPTVPPPATPKPEKPSVPEKR